MAPPPNAAGGATPATLASVCGSHSEGHGTTAGVSGGNSSPSVGSAEGRNKVGTERGSHGVEAGSGDGVGKSNTANAKSADVEECRVAIGPGASSHPAQLARDQPTRPAGVTGDPRSSPVSAVPAAATGASSPASTPTSTAETRADPTAAKTPAATAATSSGHPVENPASAVGFPCSFPIKIEGGTAQPQIGGSPPSNSSYSRGSAPASNHATSSNLVTPESSRVLDAMASAAISVAAARGGGSRGKNPGEACNASGAPAPGPATTSGTAVVIPGQQTVPTALQPNPTSGITLQQPSAPTAVATPQTVLSSTVIHGASTASTTPTSTTTEVNAVPNNAAAVSRPVSPLSQPLVNTTLAHGAGGSPASPPIPCASAPATGVTTGTPMRPSLQQTYSARGAPTGPCARVQPLGKGLSGQSQPQLTTVPGSASLVVSSVPAVSTSTATVSVVASPAGGMTVSPVLMNATVARASGQQPPRAPTIGSAAIPTTNGPQVHAHSQAYEAGRGIVPVGDRGVAAPGAATVATSPAPVHAGNFHQHHRPHYAGAVIYHQPQISGSGGVPFVAGGRGLVPVAGARPHGVAGRGVVYGAGATPPRGAVTIGGGGVAATTGAPSPTSPSHHQPPAGYPRQMVPGATPHGIPTHPIGMHCIHRSALPLTRGFEQDVVGGTRLGPGLQVNGIGASGEVDEAAPIKEVR